MNTVQIDFRATLDLSQGSAAITIKITDLYAQPPPPAPEFEFDYDVDSTTARRQERPAIEIQEAQP